MCAVMEFVVEPSVRYVVYRCACKKVAEMFRIC